MSPVNSQFLYQIEAMGTVVNLELINNLNSSPYYAGDVSPNGDGINDFSTLCSGDPVIINQVEIFNRCGVKIFSAKGISTNENPLGWNRFFKNERMNPGIYIWQAEIEFLDGVVERKFGEVLLLR